MTHKYLFFFNSVSYGTTSLSAFTKLQKATISLWFRPLGPYWTDFHEI